jgi:hypothetical protein
MVQLYGFLLGSEIMRELAEGKKNYVVAVIAF